MRIWILLCLLAGLSAGWADEVLFTSGPQAFEGRKYYWLAEWKLEITLPDDVGAGDRLEVLFGTKGGLKRTLYYKHENKTGSMKECLKTPYEWLAVPLEELSGGKVVTLYGIGRDQVAFIAGVRIKGKSKAPIKVKPVRTAFISVQSRGLVWADLPGFEVNDRTRKLWDPEPAEPDWARAARSARYAGIALDKVQRWLHDCCLPIRDERSGLFRPTGPEWNYRDTAADCYPFYVWAAFYTDRKILDTVMRDVLAAEMRLCNHLDDLPVRYNMDKGEKVITSFDAMIFGASEYAKDGLVPIVEITGKDQPWFGRLRGIVDSIFKHARHETPHGKIPSTNIEVNGELLQILPRLYRMTGERKYLDWAHRLADHYLLPGKFVPSRLSDHGCEIIGGLGLLFAVDQTACPEKAKAYLPHLQYMFGEILKRGTNSDGIIIRSIQSSPGPHDKTSTGDGWGYDLVGFLDVDMARDTAYYYKAIQKPLRNLLKPRYLRFNWDHGSRDNVADSVEGGLYLLHRFPTPAGFIWADREMATLLVDHSNPDRLWGLHKLEANTVRTVLIHTMLHTRNTIARPWRQGLQLGAAPSGDGICVFMASEKDYQGLLQFDIPRHRLYMGFQQDWPRMNAVPEWFTVEPDEKHLYSVKNVEAGLERIVSGKALSRGLPVTVPAGRPLKLLVQPKETKGRSSSMEEKTIYDIPVDTIAGETITLDRFRGKVLLMVNTASKCGFTYQYAGLQKLYETYRERGLVVLGFPANNFLWQEPGTNPEIQAFCTGKFGVTFPMFAKMSVKGKKQHPLYRFLTSPETNPEHSGKITWNFNKFLIGPAGAVLGRFGSRTKPEDPKMVGQIEAALKLVPE